MFLNKHIYASIIFYFIVCNYCFTQNFDSTEWARKKIFEAPSQTLIPSGVQSVRFIDVITKPVIETFINGKGPFRMLVDAGANITLLQKKIAEQLQLRNLRPDGGKLLLVDSIKIGLSNFSEVIVGEDEWNENIDGVIGLNLFKNCIVSFDYPKQLLTVSNGKLFPANNKTIFSYYVNYRLPFYKIVINGDTLNVLLDTGMSGYLAINSKIKDSFQFADNRKRISTSSKYYKGNAILTTLKNKFNIGNYTFQNCPIVISHEEGNRIGSGIFQYFKLTFDQQNKLFELLSDKTDFVY